MRKNRQTYRQRQCKERQGEVRCRRANVERDAHNEEPRREGRRQTAIDIIICKQAHITAEGLVISLSPNNRCLRRFGHCRRSQAAGTLHPERRPKLGGENRRAPSTRSASTAADCPGCGKLALAHIPHCLRGSPDRAAAAHITRHIDGRATWAPRRRVGKQAAAHLKAVLPGTEVESSMAQATAAPASAGLRIPMEAEALGGKSLKKLLFVFIIISPAKVVWRIERTQSDAGGIDSSSTTRCARGDIWGALRRVAERRSARCAPCCVAMRAGLGAASAGVWGHGEPECCRLPSAFPVHRPHRGLPIAGP
jgi:hypothetical protein